MCRVIFTYSTYTVCVHKSTADNRPVRAPAATQHAISSQSAALCKSSCVAALESAAKCHMAIRSTCEHKRPTPQSNTWGHVFKPCCGTSYCCMKELRLTRLRGSHSSCRISALDVRAAAAARITITMKRKLVTTFTVVSDL